VNRLQGTIVAIDSNHYMSLVDVKVGGDIFVATLLETPASADYLKVGMLVNVLFKETEVALARDLAGQISMRNRFKVKVLDIQHGEILSALTLDYAGKLITSIITTRAVQRLQIKPSDELEALVKANEVALEA
jgi:molybdate transport system regulatory protein